VKVGLRQDHDQPGGAPHAARGGGRVVYRIVGAGRPSEPAEVDLRALSTAGLAPYRKPLQIVFQDPYGSLNPR
jgi:ABC-type microcin C transport system duplicated ATPase subunit YejF